MREKNNKYNYIGYRRFVFGPGTNIGTQKMAYICHRTSDAPRSCDKYRPFFSFLYLSQGLNKSPIIHIQDYFSGPIYNIGQFFLPYIAIQGSFLPLYHFYTEIQEIILYRIQKIFSRACEEYRDSKNGLYLPQDLGCASVL